MSLEERVKVLEFQMANLQEAFISAQRLQTTTVGRVDDTSNRITQITPYTASNTAYIGDTEVVFENVPQGNLSVFGLSEYSIDRQSDRITIMFDAVDEVTTVSISIQ